MLSGNFQCLEQLKKKQKAVKLPFLNSNPSKTQAIVGGRAGGRLSAVAVA